MAARSTDGKPRGNKKQETHERIVACARELIEEVGFEKATIRLISTRMGLAVGTIHSHFATKQDLFFAIFHDDIEAIFAAAIQEAAARETLRDKLYTTVALVWQAFADKGEVHADLLRNALFAKGPWAVRYEQQVHRVAMQLAQWYIAAGCSDPGQIEARILNFVSAYYFVLMQLVKSDFATVESGLQQFATILDFQLRDITP